MVYKRTAKTVQRYVSLSGRKTTVNTTTRICKKYIGVTKDTERRNLIDKDSQAEWVHNITKIVGFVLKA